MVTPFETEVVHLQNEFSLDNDNQKFKLETETARKSVPKILDSFRHEANYSARRDPPCLLEAAEVPPPM